MKTKIHYCKEHSTAPRRYVVPHISLINLVDRCVEVSKQYSSKIKETRVRYFGEHARVYFVPKVGNRTVFVHIEKTDSYSDIDYSTSKNCSQLA